MTRTGWIRVESPLGWIRLAAGHGRLTGLHIEPDSPFLIDTGARQPDSSGADQLLLAEAARQLTEYLAGGGSSGGSGQCPQPDPGDHPLPSGDRR